MNSWVRLADEARSGPASSPSTEAPAPERRDASLTLVAQEKARRLFPLHQSRDAPVGMDDDA
jgi:hypothetical protein